jgi:L-threonylcarbamoyladenylate synthase
MPIKILKSNEQSIKKAAEIIKKGGLVIFPTETVYGLGADAFNEKAVAKIFEVKKRPKFDPIIVHIADINSLKLLATNIPPVALKLIEKFWPGPLTIVIPKRKGVPDIVTAGLPTVAVRMPSHPVALKLIKNSQTPIAAPSANIFGKLSPTEPSHIIKEFKNSVDLIIDNGKTPIGVESTVISFLDKPVILRPGGVTIEEIEKVIGKVEIKNTSENPISPGQFKTHYAPNKKLKIINSLSDLKNIKKENAGFLAFKKRKNIKGFKKIEFLSKNGNLNEAACNLFSALHKLQNSDVDIIYVETVPQKGLGLAIMDRLKKAETK